MRENADQTNSVYGHFLRSEFVKDVRKRLRKMFQKDVTEHRNISFVMVMCLFCTYITQTTYIHYIYLLFLFVLIVLFVLLSVLLPVFITTLLFICYDYCIVIYFIIISL